MAKKKRKVKTDSEPATDGLKIKLSQKGWNGLSNSSSITSWPMSSKESPWASSTQNCVEGCMRELSQITSPHRWRKEML
jgi:hypothetical protein